MSQSADRHHVNGHITSSSHLVGPAPEKANEQQKPAANEIGHHADDDDHSQPDIFNATCVADIKATLSLLHDREASVTARLDALLASQKDFSRELRRLDLLRAHLGSQAGTARAISHGMLSDAAATAHRISSAV